MASKNGIFISSCRICSKNLRNFSCNFFFTACMEKVAMEHVDAQVSLALKFSSTFLHTTFSSHFLLHLSSLQPQHSSSYLLINLLLFSPLKIISMLNFHLKIMTHGRTLPKINLRSHNKSGVLSLLSKEDCFASMMVRFRVWGIR